MWLFSHHFLIFLIPLVPNVNALNIPQRSPSELTPRMCRTNVTLPSYPEPCFSTCDPVREMQKQCKDKIPCMCQNAKPVAFSRCVQCVMDAAGDLLLLIPDYLNETSQNVAAYTKSCTLLDQSGDSNAQKREFRKSPIATQCGSPGEVLLIHDPPNFLHPPVSKLRPFFPYLSVIAAIVFIFVFLLHK